MPISKIGAQITIVFQLSLKLFATTCCLAMNNFDASFLVIWVRETKPVAPFSDKRIIGFG